MAAIDAAKERLAPYLDRVTLVHSNFSELESVLGQAGVSGADGMLFDLGVSSPSWTTAAGAFPTCTMPRWTCAWTALLP